MRYRVKFLHLTVDIWSTVLPDGLVNKKNDRKETRIVENGRAGEAGWNDLPLLSSYLKKVKKLCERVAVNYLFLTSIPRVDHEVISERSCYETGPQGLIQWKVLEWNDVWGGGPPFFLGGGGNLSE